MTIGEKIKATRKAMGITIEELTELTGVTHSNISNIENGKQNGTWNSLSRIFTALNIDVIPPTVVIENSGEKTIIHKRDLTSWFIKTGTKIEVTEDYDMIKNMCNGVMPR